MQYEQLEQYLQDFFSDTSRPAADTKRDLLAIAEQAQMLAESIDDDEGELDD